MVRDDSAPHSFFEPPELARWVARIDPARLEILGDDGAGADDHVGGDMDAAENRYVGADADIIVNPSRFLEEPLV